MRQHLVLLAVLGLCTFSGVYSEDAADGEVVEEAPSSQTGEEDFEAEELGPSRDAVVSFIFAQPSDANVHRELDAGKIVKYLIGIQNRGEKDFIIQRTETSLRYPLDWNYRLHNFTNPTISRRVAPKEEITIDYTFFAFDSLAGRPLGLVVDLYYQDSEGRTYLNNVFNETVTFVEDDSGFNTETGFLYLLFAGFAVGLLLIGQHYLNKLTRKTGLQKRRQAAEPTTSDTEVDYEWIPRDILKQKEKKSPNPKPSSPKTRRSKKAD